MSFHRRDDMKGHFTSPGPQFTALAKICGAVLQECVSQGIYRADGSTLIAVDDEDCRYELMVQIDKDVFAVALIPDSSHGLAKIKANVFSFVELISKHSGPDLEGFRALATVRAIFDRRGGQLRPVDVRSDILARPGEIARLAALDMPCFVLDDPVEMPNRVH
jgi:hypothetical protein